MSNYAPDDGIYKWRAGFKGDEELRAALRRGFILMASDALYQIFTMECWTCGRFFNVHVSLQKDIADIRPKCPLCGFATCAEAGAEESEE